MSVYIRPLRHSIHTAPAPEGNNLIYRAGAKRVKLSLGHLETINMKFIIHQHILLHIRSYYTFILHCHITLSYYTLILHFHLNFHITLLYYTLILHSHITLSYYTFILHFHITLSYYTFILHFHITLSYYTFIHSRSPQIVPLQILFF